jgi:hypothetical protein
LRRQPIFELSLADAASIDGVFRRHHVGGNPVSFVDPTGLDTTIFVSRQVYTSTTITGRLDVISTQGGTFSGTSLENRTPPNASLPIPPGVYPATTRTDHTPNRLELGNVPNATHVQIYVGNTQKDVVGCVAAGSGAGVNSITGSVAAMNAINGIVAADGGAVTVIVIGGNGR